MSVPHAVLILCFRAIRYAISVLAKHLNRFGPLLRAGRECVGQIVGERLKTQPDAPVGDQLGGCLVHQVAVLDALDAGGDRPLD
jgi:hypothetical protein